ncbi:MAG: FtsW/RodA/SpoVE family cell cycle protein, partial [Actinomycetota bacterium]
VILISLYTLLIFSVIRIGTAAKDKFGALFCGGIAILLSVHLLINIGVTIGIMPITGITLPLISYGGSSLVTTFLGLGLVEGVYLRRFYNI